MKYLKTQTKEYIYKNPEINTTISLQNNNYALKILKLADNDDKNPRMLKIDNLLCYFTVKHTGNWRMHLKIKAKQSKC